MTLHNLFIGLMLASAFSVLIPSMYLMEVFNAIIDRQKNAWKALGFLILLGCVSIGGVYLFGTLSTVYK